MLGGVLVPVLLALAVCTEAQQIPRQTRPTTAAIEGRVINQLNLGVGGVTIEIRNSATGTLAICSEVGRNVPCMTNGDGIFRALSLPPGTYEVSGALEGFEPFQVKSISVVAGQTYPMQETMKEIPSFKPLVVPHNPGTDPPPSPPYRLLINPITGLPEEAPPEPLPPYDKVFEPMSDRWKYTFPQYRRYGMMDGEVPWTTGRFIDPFSKNKLKGDFPVIGQRTFLNLNLSSATAVELRKIPLPSGLGAQRPDSAQFFGEFAQFPFSENVSLSATLFHGDTVFRPIDWQFRVTPEFNINYLNVRENGIVNADVRKGNTRLDTHIGLQEGFFEIKLRDLGGAYDFISARVGVQCFNSDFRGFIFHDCEPGFRIFGNLKANRFQYNAAYFYMLEKDTNSGLNRFERRDQQVFIANLFRQDFIKPGYTIQVSFHYDKDDPSFVFDQNHFLARPTPIARFTPHAVRAYYYGLTGDGHFGRINVNHAFYQVLGTDKNNLLANNRIDINAHMAALELSLDKDWIRYRLSYFYSSGEKDPRRCINQNFANTLTGSKNKQVTDCGHGFDAIFDDPNFAGGIFSFWNREGIRLLGSGAALVSGGSLIPSLRSSKEEGQANFSNPGIHMFNAGADIDVTPKIRGFINFNAIRFDHTETMQELLFQGGIHKGVGADSGLGIIWRPPLSDNIIVTTGVNMFNPFQGFRDILSGQTLFSVFANVKFKF